MEVIRKFIIYLCIVGCFLPEVYAQQKRFTVVIDPGHGGKDPGARNKSLYEKTINLGVALKLGDLIKTNFPNVKVIYTRKTDVFIELNERADIANRNKADLFISIHTNSVARGSSARGTETYTLGLARTDENLAVAMRENSAILLEEDYLQKYEGFDPKSSESYIIFEFMQNTHMEQSVSFASKIQKNFTAADRKNRGVRQAGFLVLRKTSMPSVLVELGYITNPGEAQYMSSSSGQQQLARAIYKAFVSYKQDYDRKQGGLSDYVPGVIPDEADEPEYIETTINERAEESEQETVQPRKDIPEQKSVKTEKVVYKIQLFTSDKKLKSDSRLFKGYKDISYYREGVLYKYTYGESTDFNTIRKLRRQVAKDFKDAFIVAFKGDKKVKY